MGQAGPTRFAGMTGGGKTQMKSAKMAEMVEPMGVGCCDLGCLLILSMVFITVKIIIGVMTGDLETYKDLFKAVWDMFKSFVGIGS